MGRKFAPSCANIYLRDFDEKAMNSFHIKPLLYGRFLDDIFGIWPGTRPELEEYETYLNNLIPGIKVKFTARNRIIKFLATQVYKSKDNLGRCVLATKVIILCSIFPDFWSIVFIEYCHVGCVAGIYRITSTWCNYLHRDCTLFFCLSSSWSHAQML